MESIIDNCQLPKKQHRLEPNCDPQSSAQHRTYRAGKMFIKIPCAIRHVQLLFESGAYNLFKLCLENLFLINPLEKKKGEPESIQFHGPNENNQYCKIFK
jgi:hypothetical protein